MTRTMKLLLAGAALAGASGLQAAAHDLQATPIAGQGMRTLVTGFAGPEAVYVAPGADHAIVSNTNGNSARGPAAADPQPGFLSKLGFDGQIQELHWVQDERFKGLTGMRNFEDTLYVANGTSIAAVNMTSGEVLGVYECPGAGFINDIATGPDGAVYGSESFQAGIYTIAPGSDECTWFIEGTPAPAPGTPPDPNAPVNPLQTINGLYGADDALMVVTIPGRVLSVDYGTKEITVLGEGLGSFDGIEPAPGGGWLISDTRGKLVHFHDGEVQVLNDTSSGGIGANDMAFDPETGTALLARLAINAISLYRVE